MLVQYQHLIDRLRLLRYQLNGWWSLFQKKKLVKKKTDKKRINKNIQRKGRKKPFEDEHDDAEEEVACEDALGAGDEGIPACIIISREENLFLCP